MDAMNFVGAMGVVCMTLLFCTVCSAVNIETVPGGNATEPTGYSMNET